MEFRDILLLISSLIAASALVLNVLDRGKKRFDEVRKEFKDVVEPIENQLSEIRKLIHDLDGRTKVAETQMAIFWKGVAYSGASLLHSPHSPEFDKLLEGFVEETLLPMERMKLQSMLMETADDVTETPMRKYLAREVLLCMAILTHFETFPLPNLGILAWWKDYGNKT